MDPWSFILFLYWYCKGRNCWLFNVVAVPNSSEYPCLMPTENGRSHILRYASRCRLEGFCKTGRPIYTIQRREMTRAITSPRLFSIPHSPPTWQRFSQETKKCFIISLLPQVLNKFSVSFPVSSTKLQHVVGVDGASDPCS